MRDLFFYVDRALANSGARSERKLAEMLGLSHNIITHWRRGALPTDETMIRLAQVAAIDPAIALLDLSTWRTEGLAQTTYKKILEKITAAALVIGFCFSMSGPALAQAGNELAARAVCAANADLYIITSAKVLRRALLALFNGIFTRLGFSGRYAPGANP